jgi:hypothetical protein
MWIVIYGQKELYEVHPSSWESERKSAMRGPVRLFYLVGAASLKRKSTLLETRLLIVWFRSSMT